MIIVIIIITVTSPGIFWGIPLLAGGLRAEALGNSGQYNFNLRRIIFSFKQAFTIEKCNYQLSIILDFMIENDSLNFLQHI